MNTRFYEFVIPESPRRTLFEVAAGVALISLLSHCGRFRMHGKSIRRECPASGTSGVGRCYQRSGHTGIQRVCRTDLCARHGRGARPRGWLHREALVRNRLGRCGRPAALHFGFASLRSRRSKGSGDLSQSDANQEFAARQVGLLQARRIWRRPGQSGQSAAGCRSTATSGGAESRSAPGSGQRASGIVRRNQANVRARQAKCRAGATFDQRRRSKQPRHRSNPARPTS